MAETVGSGLIADLRAEKEGEDWVNGFEQLESLERRDIWRIGSSSQILYAAIHRQELR